MLVSSVSIRIPPAVDTLLYEDTYPLQAQLPLYLLPLLLINGIRFHNKPNWKRGTLFWKKCKNSKTMKEYGYYIPVSIRN